jgi:hypothetical protein
VFDPRTAAPARAEATRVELDRVRQGIARTTEQLDRFRADGSAGPTAIGVLEDFIRIEGIRAGMLEWLLELYRAVAAGREAFP